LQTVVTGWGCPRGGYCPGGECPRCCSGDHLAHAHHRMPDRESNHGCRNHFGRNGDIGPGSTRRTASRVADTVAPSHNAIGSTICGLSVSIALHSFAGRTLSQAAQNWFRASRRCLKPSRVLSHTFIHTLQRFVNPTHNGCVLACNK